MDAFAELGLPRAPTVNCEWLAQRFDALARERHPDMGGDEGAFARLSEARAILSSTARRLRNLLDLEFPGHGIDGPIEGTLMDLFSRTAKTLDQAGSVITEKSSAASALARARLLPRELAARESLESLLSDLDARMASVESAAARWDQRAGSLAALAREAAFIEKWRAQILESLAQLGI